MQPAAVPRPGRHAHGCGRARPRRCSPRAAATTTMSGGGGGGGGGEKRSRSRTGPATCRRVAAQAFRGDTGISVNYDEDINANNEYFAKIRPNLSKDESIGRDGFVLTDWMANRLINQVKWVQPLDEAEVPEQGEPAPGARRRPPSIPTRKYSAPWASGRDRDRLQHRDHRRRRSARSTTSSRVGHQDRPRRDARHRRTVHAGDRWQTREADLRRRRARVRRARSRRSTTAQIDGVNGNEYVDDLGAGNLAAAFAWSGDVAQITLDNPDVRFAVPDTGGMLWSDNFMIPYTTDKVDRRERVHQLLLRPRQRGGADGRSSSSSRRSRAWPSELTAMGGDAAAARRQPTRRPDRRVPGDAVDLRAARRGRRGEVRRAVRGDHRHRLSV